MTLAIHQPHTRLLALAAVALTSLAAAGCGSGSHTTARASQASQAPTELTSLIGQSVGLGAPLVASSLRNLLLGNLIELDPAQESAFTVNANCDQTGSGTAPLPGTDIQVPAWETFVCQSTAYKYGQPTIGQPIQITVNGSGVITDAVSTTQSLRTTTDTGSTSGPSDSSPSTTTTTASPTTTTGTVSAPPSGQATGPTDSAQSTTQDFFRSPSANIQCEIDYGVTALPDGASCQTTSPPESVTMATDGTLQTCRGDNGCLGDGPDDQFTLAYGTSTGLGPFRCRSAATSGITCTVSGSVGFEISGSGIRRLT